MGSPEMRKIEQDEAIGELWQVTSRGSNGLTYFTHPVWLHDSTGLVFTSNRSGTREAYLIEWPGSSITRITRGGVSSPVVSRGGESILFIHRGRMVEQGMDGADRKVISSLPDCRSYGQIGQLCDGCSLAVCCNGEDESILIRSPREGGHSSVFHRDQRRLSHLIPSPSEPELASVAWTCWGGGETPQRLWLTDLKRGGTTPIYEQPEGELVTHEAWSGDGRWIAFTAGPFDRSPGSFSLKMIDPETGDLVLAAEGGNFWHCCPNRDGSMIVADTNWPDEGIMLVDVESGEVETLCLSRSSIDVHPHPRFSPDGSKVAFTSDVSGSSQVYVVELP